MIFTILIGNIGYFVDLIDDNNIVTDTNYKKGMQFQSVDLANAKIKELSEKGFECNLRGYSS